VLQVRTVIVAVQSLV